MKQYSQTKLTFVRHGETELNARKCYFGHLNPSLTDNGEKQAKQTAEILKDEKFDYIFSSDLARCDETGKIINHFHNMYIENNNKLREMNFGIFEGKTHHELLDEFPKESKKFFDNWKDHKIPNGESITIMQKRAIDFIDNIIKQHKGKSLLIITHSGIIRALLSHYICPSLDTYWKFRIDYASITKLNFNSDGYAYAECVNRI